MAPRRTRLVIAAVMSATEDHVTTCRKGGTDLDAVSLPFGKKSVKTRKVSSPRGLPPIGKRNSSPDLFPAFDHLLIECRQYVGMVSFREGCMFTIATVILLSVMGLLLHPASHTAAQPAPFREPDGTTGTISPLGNGQAIYSDAHGNTHPTQLGSGLPSHSFSGPHGAAPGTVTPFGTPAPPNLLTPAPLLPLQPKGMAIPQPQAPVVPSSPGRFGPSGGRPGH